MSPRTESNETLADEPFEAAFDLSPFTLFDRLRRGDKPLLVDVRATAGATTLVHARRIPPEEPWQPPAEGDVVLFDDDGATARRQARSWHRRGFGNVRALYGGLELWELCFPHQVVGEETFLRPAAGDGDEGEAALPPQ